MSAPRFSVSERREVAERYENGESIPRLAESYGVGWGVIHRALIKEGIPRRRPQEYEESRLDWTKECRECGQLCHKNAVRLLCVPCAKRFCQTCETKLPEGWRSQHCSTCRFARRYAKKPPRLCRVCGRMGARSSKRDLCPVHIKTFCKVCDQGLPPQRVNLRCTACEQAHKEKLWAKPGRICCQCGEREAKVHSSRCQHCLHEDYEVFRWARLHMDIPCRKCGVTLTKGRQVNYCQPCYRQRHTERKRFRLALGAHRCAMCKEELPLSRDTYCKGCDYMLGQWRKAWHAGNPTARLLGTVRTQKRWQAEAKAA